MPPEKKMRTEDTHFVWTDVEVQSLLETTRDFKAKKAYAEVYWESIKEKYGNIREIFVSNLANRRTVKNMHIQQTSSLEKGLLLKSNRFVQNIEKIWMQDSKVEEVE